MPKGMALAKFGGRTAEFKGSTSPMAPESIIAELKIKFDVQEPRVSSVAMAGLASAPVPTKYMDTVPTHHTVQTHAPVLEDGVLMVIICIRSIHANLIPSSATNIVRMKSATSAQVTLDPAKVTSTGKEFYTLHLDDTKKLPFTFHDAFAEKAAELLVYAKEKLELKEGQEAIRKRLEDAASKAIVDGERCKLKVSPLTSVPTADVSAYNAFNDRSVISPVPMNVEGGSKNWADDDEDVYAPASPAPALLSREEVPSALSGVFVNVGFRENKPTTAQKKEARNQAKLAEARHQAELAETERLKNEARKETFNEESIRIELEAQRMMEEEKKEQRRRESLRAEYDAVQPFIWAHLGITMEQFLANPDECRTRIAELQSLAQQEEFEQEEEKSAISVTHVTIHTPHRHYMEGLCRQARTLGIAMTMYQNGDHWCVDISECDMKKLNVFQWNQHIWVSAIKNGYKVQVGRGSYQALMEIMPDVASIVHEAMELQDQLDHRKQGLLSHPSCPQYYQYQATGASPFVIVPVLDIHGNFICLQQVSRYA